MIQTNLAMEHNYSVISIMSYFCIKKGMAVRTYVDVLHSNINSFAITGCQRKETTINEGDIIITSGNLNLADGTEVKLN